MLLGKERTAPGTASKHRLLDDEAVGVGVSEQLQIAAGRLIYAPQCGLFYASLLTASIVEIVWISHPWVPSGYHWCVRTRTFSHESNAIASAPLTTALPLPHCSLLVMESRSAAATFRIRGRASSCASRPTSHVASSLRPRSLSYGNAAPFGRANPIGLTRSFAACPFSPSFCKCAAQRTRASPPVACACAAADLLVFAPGDSYWFGVDGGLDEVLLLILVCWLALRICRLTAIIQKMRERRRRGMEDLDVSFAEGDDDDDDDDDGDDDYESRGCRFPMQQVARSLGPDRMSAAPWSSGGGGASSSSPGCAMEISPLRDGTSPARASIGAEV